MIKSKFKRVTSLFLATLMCVTTFAGISSTTAYAASGEKADVYMVDFPRDGDANYDGVWGHSNLTLKNGWHTGRSNFTNLKAIGSYSGNVAYCIEPGISLKVGQTMNKYDENYFNNLASNGVISGDEIRLFVGRILQYGYRGTISTSWRSQDEAAANSIAQAYATQLLIWETVIGERDANFNHVAASGCSNVKDVINAKHPLRNKIFSYYNSMVQSVQNHATIPSFCNKSSGSAKTIELEWNGSKYTTTLTDSNNVLSKYNFKASISGVSFSVNGNKLTVSMDTAPSKEFTITATKKNAVRRGVVVWSEGKHGQNSSVQDVVSYAQEVSDSINGYVKMKVSYGSCQIVKTSEDGKVDGINFTITGNGINQTVTTANGGKFQIDNLMPGIYTVTEQAYDKYEPQETHRVTVVAGQVAKVNFNNKLKRGDLQVVKSSEDNLVEGVKFHLYGTSLSGDAVDQYAVTDKNGVATFKDVLISGSEPYTLEEVDTAIRYVVPKNQTAPVKWKEVTTRNFNNILKKFTVTVTKSDAEKGEAQGNAKLSGAVYGIYKGETLVDKYVTDENGQFTTKEYVCDTDWTIREITPSEGYLLDKTIHEVGADPKLYEVEHNLTSNDVTEQVIKGNVAIIKHTDDGETKIETPEKGASFEIYLKSAGSYDAANKDERDTIVCDENGFGQTKDMPYGIYTVHQTSGWEGREMMDDFDVFISQNAQTYRYLINNRNFESFVNVVKVDAESGKSIPYAGAGFKIYDPQGNQVKMTFTYPTPTTIDVFYTDANGSLVTPEKLDYGKGYSIVEVQAPYGYVLDDTPVYFDITEENSTEEGGVTVVKVNKPNMAQKGTIMVEKTGEVFSGVNVSGSEDSDVIYQPVYEVAGLEGAVYEVRAAEDISTPDGTLRYSKGEVVDTITTSSDGFVKSKELYLGKYEVKGWAITMKKISIILLSAVLVFSMAACNGGKEKADNQTEKQTESVKPTEEAEMATEAVTEVTTEAGSEETDKDIAEAKDSEEKTDKADNWSADNETASKQEKKSEQNDEPEQKAPASGNKEAGGNQSNAGNGGQITDSPKDNVSNPQPASVAYSPQNVVSLATAKCQAGGMITTQQNLQNHLNDGSITQEEYNEYYPYDGMEGSYYSVFVETDLNKASSIDGQRLSSEDAIAEYIASMLLLETDPVFYISYDGVYTTGGTDYYEFRCHR